MSIVLFKEITTDDALLKIEEEAKKYTGLYVDMDNAPERKYVKDKASEIQGILKRLDRSRIDKARDYKVKVEKEASIIKDRLEAANSPFTFLIDAHKKKRADILAEEKRIEDLKELMWQKERDHEFALLVDAQVMADKAAAELAQKERDDNIAKEAADAAEARIKLDIQRDKEAEERAIREREADVTLKARVNNSILSVLTQIGVTEIQGKEIIKAICMGKIPNVRIDY